VNLEVLPQISNVSERLHLSPRLSQRRSTESFTSTCSDKLLDIPTDSSTPIYNVEVSKTSQSELRWFIQGLRDGPVTDDVTSVMTDVNNGNWSKVADGGGEVLGVVTRLWFENLTCPLLTQFEVDMIVMKSEVNLSSNEENKAQLAKLNTSLNNLTRAQVGVLHCLLTTFTLLMQGPMRDSKEEILQVLANLILQDNKVTGSASATHLLLKSGDTSCRMFCRKKPGEESPKKSNDSVTVDPPTDEPPESITSEGVPLLDGEVVEDIKELKHANKKFCRVLQLLMNYKYRKLIGDIV